MGLLEGYFVPLYDYHQTASSFDQKVCCISLLIIILLLLCQSVHHKNLYVELFLQFKREFYRNFPACLLSYLKSQVFTAI